MKYIYLFGIFFGFFLASTISPRIAASEIRLTMVDDDPDWFWVANFGIGNTKNLTDQVKKAERTLDKLNPDSDKHLWLRLFAHYFITDPASKDFNSRLEKSISIAKQLNLKDYEIILQWKADTIKPRTDEIKPIDAAIESARSIGLHRVEAQFLFLKSIDEDDEYVKLNLAKDALNAIKASNSSTFADRSIIYSNLLTVASGVSENIEKERAELLKEFDQICEIESYSNLCAMLAKNLVAVNIADGSKEALDKAKQWLEKAVPRATEPYDIPLKLQRFEIKILLEGASGSSVEEIKAICDDISMFPEFNGEACFLVAKYFRLHNNPDTAMDFLSKAEGHFAMQHSKKIPWKIAEERYLSSKALNRPVEALKFHEQLLANKLEDANDKMRRLSKISNSLFANSSSSAALELAEERRKGILRESEIQKMELDYERRSGYIKIGASIVLLFLACITTLGFFRIRGQHKEIARLQTYIEVNVLQRFLPPELVAEIRQGRSRLDSSAQKRNITVMFCDLVEFTSSTEILGPDRLSSILNSFLVKMTEIIYAHGGTIDKFIGDAIMTIFGAPSDLDPCTQVEQATKCAVAMIEGLQELNKIWKTEHDIEFAVRIGINHGEAVVGSFGSNKRSDYTAIGTAVNVASRVEGKASPNQIFVTKSVATYLDARQYKSQGMFKLKGIKSEYELFCINQMSLNAEKNIA